ncbi:MAG: hypothetical protein HQK84_11990 [Nitrospinae bacterium]|nr:hypothetical protein [Nitrospinota bacterium]
MHIKQNLKKYIIEAMDMIDESLDRLNVPVYRRFIHAAHDFVDIYIIDSSYKSKKDLKSSSFFYETIIATTYNWYHDKYGQLAIPQTTNNYSGLILIHGVVKKIIIPSTISKYEEHNNTFKITFPDCFQDSEKIEDFFEFDLSTIKLDDTETSKIIDKFHLIVSLTRKINLNTMSISDFQPNFRKMSVGIWSHFENAINGFLSLNDSIVSVGCWDLHFAVEKSMKIYLSLFSITKRTHDLMELSDLIMNEDDSLNLDLLKKMPDYKKAIKMRYSEEHVKITEAVNIYIIALTIVENITEKFPRKYKINNHSIWLNKPQWFDD